MRKSKYSSLQNVKIGKDTIVQDQVNLYGCTIGKNCKIDAFVYLEEGVKIGDNVKIRSFTFIPEGITIEDDVYIGPRVTFTNDKYPRSKGKWRLLRTTVKKGASIGAGALIAPGIRLGSYSSIGMGSIITKNVEDYAIVFGCPAQHKGYVTDGKFQSKVKKFLEEVTPHDCRGTASKWPWP